MKLIQIKDPEAAAKHETRYLTEGGYFSVQTNNDMFITVIPFLPMTSGIATETSLLKAMLRSQALMREEIRILLIRISQLNKMIEEEKSNPTTFPVPLATAKPEGEAGSVKSVPSVPPENEKPADTPNAAGSSNNTSPAI